MKMTMRMMVMMSVIVLQGLRYCTLSQMMSAVVILREMQEAVNYNAKSMVLNHGIFLDVDVDVSICPFQFSPLQNHQRRPRVCHPLNLQRPYHVMRFPMEQWELELQTQHVV